MPENTEATLLTTQIVAAYLGNNTVAVNDVPALISSVYTAVVNLDRQKPAGEDADKQNPAVPIKKSVRPDHIVCLECGKKNKMLKRHLASEHGLTPVEYRSRWNLPSDYPMTAPEYAQQRSEMAKSIGLGRGRVRTTSPTAPAPSPLKGRRKKTA